MHCGADVAKDKTEAFFVRRFHMPVIWRAGTRTTQSTSFTSLAISASL